MRGKWLVCQDAGDAGRKAHWFAVDTDLQNWKESFLPISADTKKAKGPLWLRKRFYVPGEWRNVSIVLNTGLLQGPVQIWLNGELVAESKSPTPRIVAPVTKVLRLDQPNVLVMRLQPTVAQKNVGLGAPPSLVGQVRRCIDHVQVNETIQKDGSRILRIRFQVRNEGPSFKGTLSGQVWSCDNKSDTPVAALKTQSVNLAQHQSVTREAFVFLPPAKMRELGTSPPWRLRLTLKDSSGCLLADCQTPVGRFHLSIEGEKFLLNGRWVRLAGAWLENVAELTTKSELSPFELIQQTGSWFCIVRAEERIDAFLQTADERGLPCFVALPGIGAQLRPREATNSDAIRETLRAFGNNPSVAGWILPCVKDQADFGESLNLLRQESPDRLVLALVDVAQTSWPAEIGLADAILVRDSSTCEDLGGALDRLHAQFPSTAIGVVRWASGTMARAVKSINAIRQRPFVALAVPCPLLGGGTSSQACVLYSSDGTPTSWLPVVQREHALLAIGRPTWPDKPFTRESACVLGVPIFHAEPVARSFPSAAVSGGRLSWTINAEENTKAKPKVVAEGAVKLPGWSPSVVEVKTQQPFVAQIPIRGIGPGVYGLTLTATAARASTVSASYRFAVVSTKEKKLQFAKAPARSVLVDLKKWFNNDGISLPKDKPDGNFDIRNKTVGSTYPGELMPATGEPLKVDTLPGLSFSMPPKESGKKNNVRCRGQQINVPAGNYATAYFLIAAENGSQQDILTLVYKDGVETKPLNVSDWCQEPSFGETVAMKFPYRHGWQGDDEPIPCALFVQRIPINPSRTLTAFVLPKNTYIHVFGLVLQTP